MLGYGRARDDRAGSPPHRGADRSDTGGSRVPSQAGSRQRADDGPARGGLQSCSLIARGRQENLGPRVDRSEPPRPPHILKPRPVLPEPRERDDPGHPGPPGDDIDGEFHVTAHGEAHVPEPSATARKVDDGPAWSVEPPPVAIWDGLPDLCSGGESLPWCGECFTDRRRAQACPWGSLTRVVVESARDRSDDARATRGHDGTAPG